MIEAEIDKWVPPQCPLGNPQRVAQCLAFREREPGRLQLRVAVMPGSEGICDAIVDETAHAVYVRVILCYHENKPSRDEDSLNCPVHVYLEQPLNGRTVIDVDTEQALPLFVPSWARSSTPP